MALGCSKRQDTLLTMPQPAGAAAELPAAKPAPRKTSAAFEFGDVSGSGFVSSVKRQRRDACMAHGIAACGRDGLSMISSGPRSRPVRAHTAEAVGHPQPAAVRSGETVSA